MFGDAVRSTGMATTMARSISDIASAQLGVGAVGTVGMFGDAVRSTGMATTMARSISDIAKHRIDAFDLGQFHGVANQIINGGAPFVSFSVAHELFAESDSSALDSEQRIPAWLRQLIRPLVLVVGPACATEILLIAWSVASHRGPEARQAFFDIITIISFVVATVPAFNWLAKRYND
jgi:hypothetical protein